MGAGAAKQFQTDKAQHVAAVLSTVQEYQQRNHADNIISLQNDGGNYEDEKFGKELFRKTVSLAAADAKRRGGNIDNSLAQLTDADIDKLCLYAQKNNELKSRDEYPGPTVESLLTIRRNVSGPNLVDVGNADVDETTSVLSYGEDENELDDEECEPYGYASPEAGAADQSPESGAAGGAAPVRMMTPRRMADLESLELSGEQQSMLAFGQRTGGSSHSSRSRASRGGAKAKAIAAADDDEQEEDTDEGQHMQDGMEASIEVVEIENDDKDSHVSAAAEVKRTASTGTGTGRTPTSSGSGSGSGSGNGQYRPKSGTNLKFFDLNDAFSKFWDNETENSVSSLQSPGGGGMARFSPNPHRTPSRPGADGAKGKTMGMGRSGGVDSYQRSLDERNEALLGLQRQKVMSYTQNAQLEREVELLRKQLEKMEQLEKTFDMAKANRPVFHDSLKQAQQPPQPQPQPQGSDMARKQGGSGQQGFQPHWQLASIYPIDEEHAGGFNDTTINLDRSSNTVVSTDTMHSASSSRRLKKEGSGSGSGSILASRFESSSSDEEQNAKVASSSGAPRSSSGFSSQAHSSRVSRPVAKVAAQEGLHRSYTYSHHPQEPSGVSRQDHSPHQSQSQSQAIGRHGNGIRRRTKFGGPDRGAGTGAGAGAGALRHGSTDGADSDDSNNSASSINSNARLERANKVFHSDSADNNLSSAAGKQQARARRRISSSSDFMPSYGSSANSAAAEKGRSPFDAAVVGSAAISDHGQGLSERRAAAKAPDDSSACADAKSFHGDPNSNFNSNHNPGSHFKGRALQGANRRRRHSIHGGMDDLDSSHDDKPSGGSSAVLGRLESRSSLAVEDVVAPSNSSSSSNIIAAGGGGASGKEPSAPSMSSAVASVAATAKRRAGRVTRNSHDGLSSLGLPLNTDDSDGERGRQSARGSGPSHQRAVQYKGRVTQQQPQPQPQPQPQGNAAGSGKENNGNPLWSEDLDRSWAEVSLLLRKPIVSEADMLYTVAASEAGLMYIDQMDSIAKNMKVMRGALTRWLLPYDNNTRIDNQCSTPHSVLEHMPPEFKGKLSERQIHYLVAGANGVRKLVRVKIADDNDLEQARKAVKETEDFFKALYAKAKELNMKPFELLKTSNLL